MNNLSLKGSGLIVLSLFLLIINSCGRDSDGNPTTTTTGKSIRVSGVIRYEDKLYNSKGFTGGTAFKPVRFVTIEVVRNADSAVLSSTTTDSTGGYSLVFTNTGTAGVYVRVIAETDNAAIKNNTSDNAKYSFKSGIIDDSKGETFASSIDITVSSGAGGAFNILDVLTDGILFLKGLILINPPMITAFWETNSCDGTFFDGFNNSIHLLGGGSCPPNSSGDTDEYDDDVILHEFGHYAAVNFSGDDSPGGEHLLNDNTEDIRLAWSEGWAHFFSSAIRGNPSQVDTVTTRPGIATTFEIEGPSLFGSIIDLNSSSIYTTSEVSVATVLWDIFDNSNETFDALSLGISPIWDVLSNYLRLPSVLSVSIEDFWDGWFLRGHSFLMEMLSISKDRKMELFEDVFESDNSPNLTRKIAIGAIEHHTLYPAGDKDIVAFDVTSGQTYTIETLNLSNGADTYIEVLASDGATVIGNNDNRDGKTYSKNCRICPSNDTKTLSSKISITAPSTGTIFVRISRSPSSPDSAGVYGSYDIRITSP